MSVFMHYSWREFKSKKFKLDVQNSNLYINIKFSSITLQPRWGASLPFIWLLSHALLSSLALWTSSLFTLIIILFLFSYAEGFNIRLDGFTVSLFSGYFVVLVELCLCSHIESWLIYRELTNTPRWQNFCQASKLNYSEICLLVRVLFCLGLR